MEQITTTNSNGGRFAFSTRRPTEKALLDLIPDKEYSEALEKLRRMINNRASNLPRYATPEQREAALQELKAREDDLLLITDKICPDMAAHLVRTGGKYRLHIIRLIAQLLHDDSAGCRNLYGTGQLSLFDEADTIRSEAGRIKYNPREWAKAITGQSNPQTKTIQAIAKDVEQLLKIKAYFYAPQQEGFFYQTLINRENAGYKHTTDEGKDYEILAVRKPLVCALKGERDFVKHIGINQLTDCNKKEALFIQFVEYYRQCNEMKIKKAAEQGEATKTAVQFTISKDTLLRSLGLENQFAVNPQRARKTIKTAFEKAASKGLVKAGSLKEEGKNFCWLWNLE